MELDRRRKVSLNEEGVPVLQLSPEQFHAWRSEPVASQIGLVTHLGLPRTSLAHGSALVQSGL